MLYKHKWLQVPYAILSFFSNYIFRKIFLTNPVSLLSPASCYNRYSINPRLLNSCSCLNEQTINVKMACLSICRNCSLFKINELFRIGSRYESIYGRARIAKSVAFRKIMLHWLISMFLRERLKFIENNNFTFTFISF